MNLTQEEKITVLFDEFFKAKKFLISINQDKETELDSLTKFHINRALFYCQPFIKDSSFDDRHGVAYFNYNQILFNINELDYNFEADFFIPECLVIHELTHLILYYFSLMYDHKPMTEHNLEFVIFNYVLFYRYTNSVYLLRPYDIQDEPNFEDLKIDLDKFSQFIKTIKFKNLNELYLKTVHYSNKIRLKNQKTFSQKIFPTPKTFFQKIFQSLKTFLKN